jgi:hypothetical protein
MRYVMNIPVRTTIYVNLSIVTARGLPHKRPPTLVVARTTALLKYIAKSVILLKNVKNIIDKLFITSLLTLVNATPNTNPRDKVNIIGKMYESIFRIVDSAKPANAACAAEKVTVLKPNLDM